MSAVVIKAVISHSMVCFHFPLHRMPCFLLLRPLCKYVDYNTNGKQGTRVAQKSLVKAELTTEEPYESGT